MENIKLIGTIVVIIVGVCIGVGGLSILPVPDYRFSSGYRNNPKNLFVKLFTGLVVMYLGGLLVSLILFVNFGEPKENSTVDDTLTNKNQNEPKRNKDTEKTNIDSEKKTPVNITPRVEPSW